MKHCSSAVFHTSSFPLLSFLLVNSVALHGDGCAICQSVEKELIKLSRDINCSLQVGNKCAEVGGSSSVPFPPPVWKGRVEAGGKRKNVKFLILVWGGVFVLFGHECSGTGGGMCEVEAPGLMDLPVLSPLSVCRARSQPAARRTAARARRPTLQRHPSCYRWAARVALSSQCWSQALGGAPWSHMCQPSCSARPALTVEGFLQSCSALTLTLHWRPGESERSRSSRWDSSPICLTPHIRLLKEPAEKMGKKW